MTALREVACLKLKRLAYVGRGAALATDRRRAASTFEAALVHRAACSFWQGPRLPPHGRGDTL